MAGHHIMIVLIVGMALLAAVLKARFRAQAIAHKQAPSPDTERMREEIKAMRDRIAVLERIATDRGNQLEHEIERLRDR